MPTGHDEMSLMYKSHGGFRSINLTVDVGRKLRFYTAFPSVCQYVSNLVCMEQPFWLVNYPDMCIGGCL